MNLTGLFPAGHPWVMGMLLGWVPCQKTHISLHTGRNTLPISFTHPVQLFIFFTAPIVSHLGAAVTTHI